MEILFRGFYADENGNEEIWTNGTCQGEKVKGKVNGEWIYWDKFGKLTKTLKVGKRIWGKGLRVDENDILPETVGQYTGLTDINDKKIFDKDKIIYGERIDYDLYKESVANPEEYNGIIFDKGIIEDVVVWCGENGYPAFDLKTHDMDCNALSEISAGDYCIEVIGTVFEKEEQNAKN